MQKNKTAFTMIEVIFVIVILGILAAIGIPKLVANKNDAEASKLALELGDCIDNGFGAYAKNAIFDIDSRSCNDVIITHPCFLITTDSASGIMNVKHVPDSAVGSICKRAQEVVEVNKLSSADGVNHQF
ncbi:type II secretion system GspH family protein [bacterium]|nr:type II secretion system GspH family protein [bacterium]MBU1990200.1 type II secretion system GspH family protein [bacterium]